MKIGCNDDWWGKIGEMFANVDKIVENVVKCCKML